MSPWRRSQLWAAVLILVAVAVLAAYGAGFLDWLDEPVDIRDMR